jgi:hypothetical protein
MELRKGPGLVVDTPDGNVRITRELSEVVLDLEEARWLMVCALPTALTLKPTTEEGGTHDEQTLFS